MCYRNCNPTSCCSVLDSATVVVFYGNVVGFRTNYCALATLNGVAQHNSTEVVNIDILTEI